MRMGAGEPVAVNVDFRWIFRAVVSVGRMNGKSVRLLSRAGKTSRHGLPPIAACRREALGTFPAAEKALLLALIGAPPVPVSVGGGVPACRSS